MKRREFIRTGLYGLGVGLSGAMGIPMRSFALGGSEPDQHACYQYLKARVDSGSGIGPEEFQHLREMNPLLTDPKGRVLDKNQHVLDWIERDFYGRLTEPSQISYQRWVAEMGGKVASPILLPENEEPLWLSEPDPLNTCNQDKAIPREADVVIIGAGLAGVAAAYACLNSSFSRPDQKIVLLEAQFPGCQASGKNGGNFQILTENYLDSFEGLFRERQKFLKRFFPKASVAALRWKAYQQSLSLVTFSRNNCTRLAAIVKKHQLKCDFVQEGWLKVAASRSEEDGLRNEIELVKPVGIDFEILSAEQIRKEFGIPTDFYGRLNRQSGNYHPYKFVVEALKVCIGKEKGKGLEFFPQTLVLQVEKTGDHRVEIRTQGRGTIIASRVILATNALTPQIIPGFKEIDPYQSQIMNLEHVEDRIQGMTVTEFKGDLYYNFPQGKKYLDSQGIPRGTLHVGGGPDSKIDTVNSTYRSKPVLDFLIRGIADRIPSTLQQPPSRFWSGLMGFTHDRLPLVGPLFQKGEEIPEIILAAGFNGYGGSYCIEAGYQAARYAYEPENVSEFPMGIYRHRRFF